MANNRQIPKANNWFNRKPKDLHITKLSSLAFSALLNNSVIAVTSEAQLAVYKQYNLRYETFLQGIADADPEKVKNFLNDNPELAVVACGTVTTSSGYTYENVTAVQLVFLMDDAKLMTDTLLPAIQKLPMAMIKDAEKQLANKRAEIKEQQAQFKPYDFREIAKAITADAAFNGSDTSNFEPNEDTQQALAKLKEAFKPGNISEGKSWIKEQIQQAFRILDENCARKLFGFTWNLQQSRWYLINVIGHLQTLVEKCFEQECSVGWKRENTRNVTITNLTEDKDVILTYRGAANSSMVLGRDFFC